MTVSEHENYHREGIMTTYYDLTFSGFGTIPVLFSGHLVKEMCMFVNNNTNYVNLVILFINELLFQSLPL